MKVKTKHKKLFKFWHLSILLVLCLSLFLTSTNTVQTVHALSSWSPQTGFMPGIGIYDGGGASTLPFIIDDNNTPIVSTMPYIVTTNEKLPGQLDAYDSLKVVNAEINRKWGDWKYANFVEYFTVKRTDGRKIYDDDGILDVSWWKNGDFGYSDEIIDYQSEIWIKTRVMDYNYNGFLGTILNTKFKSGAYFEVTWDGGEDPWDSLYPSVHDKNANTMGSGNYRNNGVNPGDEYYKLCDWDYCNAPYITIVLVGTGYWENGWWGGSYDYKDIWSFMSGFMPRSDRNWSNTLFTDDSSVVQIGNYFYSTKPFVVTASNLNNYVKINDIKKTPIEDADVLPFKDGIKMAITNNGTTKVSIENGAENQYTDYYCVIDDEMPLITIRYLNDNGCDRIQQGAIYADANGVKHQTVTGGIFRDQVQITFGESAVAPETGTVTYNGQTKPLTSGTWFTQSGDYTIVVTDAVGHTKTLKFTIDTDSPTNNINKLTNNKDYKVSKWFVTSIPYGFSDYGTYSYLNYDDALNKAKTSEKNNLVTTYYLNNISDFHYTNLVANGDTVKTGSYWYYKSIDNPNLYVYYFNEFTLNQAIEYHTKNYVSSPHYFNYKSDIFPNDYGTIISDEIYHNIWNENNTPAYIANDFIFKTSGENDSNKLYYDYVEDGITNWTEFVYNVSFKNQVSQNGLYYIKEVDYVGHESYVYVYLDLQAPILEVTARNYGSDESFTHTISKNDIPKNNELVFYYEDFNIDNVIDADTWYVIEIKNPSGITTKYTHVDNLPNFDDLGKGEFNITCYDRAGNNYSFKVFLLGKSPRIRFQADDKLQINIIAGEQYNTITDLKIYRNDVLLNSASGYDEYPDRTDDELIFISATKSEYIFNKGGLYKVEVTDSFGRVTSHEFKFEKDLPQGILKGVKHNGKTNKDVSFIFNSNKYLAVVYENNETIDVESTTVESTNLTTLTIRATRNINNEYKIILYDKTDLENLNIYKFTIKTVLPEFTLNGVDENGTTSSDVFARWEIQSGYKAIYSLNDGDEKTYNNGQVLTIEGAYRITLTDELGNQNTKCFEIDKSLDFKIYEEDIEKTIEEIRYTNKSLVIVNFEDLHIEITKDSENYPYSFGTYFNDEGNYLVRIYDDFGNNKYFEFEIDKTSPIASLIGVENNGTTSDFVQVVWEEENVTSTISRDGVSQGVYSSGTEIKLNGKYEVIVQDRAGNYIKFNFQIDNKIMFDINTFKGGISNGGVRVIAKEELKIDMYRNKEKIDYNFEQILYDDGFYEFILTDEIGNQLYFDFTILNTPLGRIEKRLDESVEIIEIQMNDEIIPLDIQDNTLYLVDEAEYIVTVFDKSQIKNFSFKLRIDTTPPALVLVGVENGGFTKNEVSTRSPSETPIYIQASADGEEFEYNVGDKMTNAGSYKLLVSDQAGNQTEYQFTIVYSFNGATIALFGGMLAIVVILIIFLVKNRKGFYKGSKEITTTEETTEEIESIEEK